MWVDFRKRADRFGGLPYKVTHALARAFSHRISKQDRKGLDFMKQTAIMLSKQASKQASKQVKLCPESGFLATPSFA